MRDSNSRADVGVVKVRTIGFNQEGVIVISSNVHCLSTGEVMVLAGASSNLAGMHAP